MDRRNASTRGVGQFISINCLRILLLLYSSIDVEIVGRDKRREGEQEDGVDRLHRGRVGFEAGKQAMNDEER